MNVVCLDFEGVLVPDIWPFIAEKTGVEDLRFTTRDFKNYRELMEKRVKVCQGNNITLGDIQGHVRTMEPYEGAREFVNWIRRSYQLIILSDTFYEFVPHFMEAFGWPSLFCHSIRYKDDTGRLEFTLRQENQKKLAVKALRSLNFKIYAAGDSYNDTGMLKEAHVANLFRAPQPVIDEFPEFENILDYEAMKASIQAAFR